jgi:archaellum component FlaC
VNVPGQPSINQPPVNQTPTYSASGTLTGPLPEHEQYFERLIEEANAKNPLFQGPDFKEFVDSKVDIDDIQDEALKYKTAYNILKSSGLTKEKLLSTGQEYLNLIGRDLNAFQSAHAGQYQKEVRQKEGLIQKKAEELQALTQRVNVLKAEINQLTQDINLTKDKLNTTKNSFLLAGENKQNEIQTELQKIAQYF